MTGGRQREGLTLRVLPVQGQPLTGAPPRLTIIPGDSCLSPDSQLPGDAVVSTFSISLSSLPPAWSRPPAPASRPLQCPLLRILAAPPAPVHATKGSLGSRAHSCSSPALHPPAADGPRKKSQFLTSSGKSWPQPVPYSLAAPPSSLTTQDLCTCCPFNSLQELFSPLLSNNAACLLGLSWLTRLAWPIQTHP